MRNKKYKHILQVIISGLTLGLVPFLLAYADFSSTNFKLENPINIIEGGQSSSGSFQYFSNTAQTDQGQSISTNFRENIGFLYFPIATSPTLSATPGNGQIVLSWTAAVPTFANITSYSVGISTISGGPYTYTAVGSSLSNTQTSLSNGTTYYFKIRSFAAGLILSESAEVSATPTAPAGGGGGGGGSSGSVATGVILSGRAYPLSKVNILKDGQLALSTIAGPDSRFEASLSRLSSGDYTFSVYGEDNASRRSSPFTFQVYITEGVVTRVSGIFISPTIAVDKSQVKRGDNIAIFGQSAPTSEIVINVNSEPEFFKSAQSDANGVYLYNFDSSVLDMGRHSTKTKALKEGEISSFSDAINFLVGNTNIPITGPAAGPAKCDLNEDTRCNLVDFSIAAFWYKKVLSEEFSAREAKYLNGDGKVDLVDFSIMAYYWTG